MVEKGPFLAITERMIVKSDRRKRRKRGVLAIFDRKIANSESLKGALWPVMSDLQKSLDTFQN